MLLLDLEWPKKFINLLSARYFWRAVSKISEVVHQQFLFILNSHVSGICMKLVGRKDWKYFLRHFHVIIIIKVTPGCHHTCIVFLYMFRGQLSSNAHSAHVYMYVFKCSNASDGCIPHIAVPKHTEIFLTV